MYDNLIQMLVLAVLILLLVFVVANFVGLWLLWVHIDRRGSDIRLIDRRVTSLEAADKAGLSQEETRQIYDRLADLDARVETMDDRTARIETYLLGKIQ